MKSLKNHISSILFLALLAFGFHSMAQSPTFSFQSKLNKDTILLGDQIEFSITAVVPKEYDVQFPFIVDTLVKGIEVLGLPVIDTLVKRSGEQQFTYKIRITSFDEDTYRIPGIKLPFTDGILVDTAVSSPLWLTVLSLPADSTVVGIFDIKPPISEPLTIAEIAPWAGGSILLVGLISLMVLYLIKRKKNEPLFFPRKPIDPPHVIALRELEKVKSKKLWDTANHKHYHTVLTDIIRFYIEGRFNIPAMEQTTDETIRSLKLSESLDKKLILDLSETLSLADLVKFARFTPNLSENEAGLNFGFRFVNETKVIVSENIDETTELNIDAASNVNQESLHAEPIKSTES
jgi:hypothetical protein